jgi:hypothetical protein
MSLQISISFKANSFNQEAISFIFENFQIKKIEYENQFEWVPVKNRSELLNIDFSQVKFKLKYGGDRIIIQNMNNSAPRIFGDKLDLENLILIKDFIEKKYLKIILSGRIQHSLESLQNSDDSSIWEIYNKDIPPYAQLIKNPLYREGHPGMDMIKKEFISIESLPGHQHLMNYDDMLWFGSSWQMYFSTLYYKYIPKPLFDDFKDCYENIIFENGLRKITLHKNVMDYDLPENRQRQWSFRQQLGIDSIAHELTRSSNRIEPLNLPVIITKQNCEKGQTRVTRFLDDDDKLVSSNRAVKKEIKEYLNDGITIVFEKTETN